MKYFDYWKQNPSFKHYLAVIEMRQLEAARQEEVGHELDRLVVGPDVLQVPRGPAVATTAGCSAAERGSLPGDGEVAGLGVEREELEVHRTGQRQRDLGAA